MTDRLIARFFGQKPPGFLTLSCTVHLPLAAPFVVGPEEDQAFRHRLRDIQWNPERHLLRGENPQIDKLIQEKQALIAQGNLARASKAGKSERNRLRSEAHQRHLRLKEITHQLREEAEEARTALEANVVEIRQELHANSILEDREFSFALYPEEKLRPFLTQLGQSG